MHINNGNIVHCYCCWVYGVANVYVGVVGQEQHVIFNLSNNFQVGLNSLYFNSYWRGPKLFR